MKGKGFLVVLLLEVVIVYFVYFMKREKSSPTEEDISRFNQTRAELTAANLESVSRAIQEWMSESGGRTPESLKDLQKTRNYGLNLTDGWGREIIYEKVSDSSLRLRSAGADGRFNTDDDIIKKY